MPIGQPKLDSPSLRLLGASRFAKLAVKVNHHGWSHKIGLCRLIEGKLYL